MKIGRIGANFQKGFESFHCFFERAFKSPVKRVSEIPQSFDRLHVIIAAVSSEKAPAQAIFIA